ncbi:MAG: DUF86 domain-containing protein [archaeon]|nr:DUF86 domain-containing protein [archaeon]
MEKRDIKERIEHKIEEIEEYLDFLVSIVPEELEEYKKELKTKAACERYAEKIIEATIDLAFLVINLKKITQLTSEDKIFVILAKNKIISDSLASQLGEAKGMRNFIIHRYGEIDDSKVFHSISEELEKNINDFLDSIKRCLK